MRALIIIDIQNDFLPGGSLAVAEADKLIPTINRIQDGFDLVVLTQDWHPADHGSFAANHPGAALYDVVDLNGLPQVLWPVHCVQHTPGAEFPIALDIRKASRVFHKGTDPEIDSYSGFFDNGRRKSTGMGEYLQAQGVTEVFICGVATDYCVKYSALDAVSLGFKTFLVEDACKGVNLNPTDVKDAIAEMRHAGVIVLKAKAIPSPVRVR